MAEVYVELKGGLGNQMFQYAAAIAFCLKHGLTLEIDLSFLTENRAESSSFTPRNFELDCFHGLKIGAKNLSKGKELSKVITEENFNSSILLARILRRNIRISGYFQNEAYFSAIKNVITENFKINEYLLTGEILGQVSNLKNVESVAIHVRRGDYLKSEVLKYHGVCSTEYYKKAINQMYLSINSPKFFVFSEDMDWVKQELLPIIPEAVLFESNANKPSWLDLLYMTECRHNIIANSSYSWWGAYLNKNPNKVVIAPKVWKVGQNDNVNVPTNGMNWNLI